METIEKTAETVEEAIAAGLEELGVQPHQVMVEVVEEPSKGLFGIGAKPAVVRLILLGQRPVEKPTPPQDKPTQSSKTKSNHAHGIDDHDEDIGEEIEETEKRFKVSEEEADEDARVGKIVLEEMLEAMGFEGDVTIYKAEPERQGENMHWILNITGKQMNRLIGRRGDTLASLQYLARLVVSRRLQRRANVIIDVAAYKSRRSDRLHQLAHRMADQAINERRTITLEPMPPHERRIVHLALRNRKDVETRSVGEGNVRKVTILPRF